jgi:hypothetical protein
MGIQINLIFEITYPEARRRSQGGRRPRRELVATSRHQYELFSVEADRLCTEFANRWSLDVDLLKARIAGLTKLETLSSAAIPQSVDCRRSWSTLGVEL